MVGSLSPESIGASLMSWLNNELWYLIMCLSFRAFKAFIASHKSTALIFPSSLARLSSWTGTRSGHLLLAFILYHNSFISWIWTTLWPNWSNMQQEALDCFPVGRLIIMGCFHCPFPQAHCEPCDQSVALPIVFLCNTRSLLAWVSDLWAIVVADLIGDRFRLFWPTRSFSCFGSSYLL